MGWIEMVKNIKYTFLPFSPKRIRKWIEKKEKFCLSARLEFENGNGVSIFYKNWIIPSFCNELIRVFAINLKKKSRLILYLKLWQRQKRNELICWFKRVKIRKNVGIKIWKTSNELNLLYFTWRNPRDSLLGWKY